VDTEYIREMFCEFGAVHIRRMFGGAGIYSGDVMFGLISDQLIYLKADEATVAAFKRENCAPFQYPTKNGKRAVMSYWRLPDRLYDDPAELAQWAKLALGVARKSAADKPTKTARKKIKKAKR
jgi:DNA transformation protein and related proteins